MAIALFDKFLNTVPQTVLEGKDISMVIMVDPPEGLPPPFLSGKGVLDTSLKMISVYDEAGTSIIHEFDLKGADLTPINEAIEALDGRVDNLEADNTQNKSDIASIKIDVTSLGQSVGVNASAISDNAKSIGDVKTTADANTVSINTITIDLGNVKSTADAADALSKTNETAISNLGQTVGQQDTQIKANASEIAAVKTTANAADTLSKENKTRLDNLPPSPDLSGYAKLGEDVNFSQVTAKDLDLSAKDGNASITNDHNINITIDGNINAAFKSSGMRLLKPVDGNGQTQNHLGDVHLNNGKKIFGADTGVLEIRNLGSIKRNNSNDSNSVSLGDGSNTYKSNGHVFNDNSGSEIFFIGNNVNVNNRVLQNVKKSDSNNDATNLGHIKELIASSSGGGAIEFKKVKSNVTGSPTYYYHNGDNHLYIEYTGDGGIIALDTMRSGVEDQVEDMVAVHNTTDTECSIRLFFNGSSVTHAVPPRSFLQGWTNRVIGEWVTVTSKDPEHVIDEQLVVKSTDLSWALSSDPRTNTQRMIASAPPVCTIIGRHSPSDSTKEKIVSVGDSNRLESQVSIFVINKQSTGHATGICSSEESSGKTWSRILDGNRGAWFTNDTANSRMASSEIDPSEYPEEQIFFTTDKGIMETYVDLDEPGEVGVIKLRQLAGYNAPKNEADIAALEVQTEKNRSVTHTFINEGSLSYDWPDSERKPLVEVLVLNTSQTINNSSVTVTDNDTHQYSGKYNTVGSVAINSLGNWANVYTYHNAYKNDSNDYYVAFNQSNSSWQLIEAANPHTSIGQHAASVTVQLGGQSSLPESFGSYTIDPDFDDIDSLEFITAEVPIQYDDVNSKVIINFNGAKPSGYVVLK